MNVNHAADEVSDASLHPNQAPLRERQGGSYEKGEAIFHDEDLPLIVYLRGDEPYAEDFVLEASEVMAMLGIRRSRLTQLAGKELRVGRIRSGRYIKPVFRKSDVLAYQEWTRPTATHQAAAKSLEQSKDALIESLADTLQDKTQVILETIESNQRKSSRTAKASNELLGFGFALLRHEIASLTKLWSDAEQKSYQSLLKRLDGVTQCLEVFGAKAEHHGIELAAIALQVSQLKLKFQEQVSHFAYDVATITTRILAFEEQIKSLQEELMRFNVEAKPRVLPHSKFSKSMRIRSARFL